MYLIVNLGLKSIRAIIFDEKGKTVFSKSLPVHTYLRGKNVEQDVTEWKVLLYKLLDEIKETTNLCEKINYISSTTSSSCVFGYDKSINPVTKVLMVSDSRSGNEVVYIKNNILYQKKNSSDSVFCSTSSNIPKLLWFKNNKPEVYEDIKYWVGAGEFLNFEFTGELFTDPLNASKSFYSEKENQYHKDILSDLLIQPDLLVRVEEIGKKFGLSDSLLNNYGFNKSCRYVLTTYDAICAVIGSNSGSKGNVCDVSGTVTSVRVLTDIKNEIVNRNSTILKQNLPLLNCAMLGSSNNLGGGIIEWYKQAFFNNKGEDVYSKMENEANLSQPGSNGIIFLPYLLGERSPFIDKDIRSTFFGINRKTTRNDFTRAVFESTAYVTNDLLSLIRSETNEVESLSVSGGLARFDIINQIKADVTNLPVNVIENFESTAIGALIILRVSLGDYKSVQEAALQLVSVRKIILPNKSNVSLYKEVFDLYNEIKRYTSKLGSEHTKLLKKLEAYSSSTIKNL